MRSKAAKTGDAVTFDTVVALYSPLNPKGVLPVALGIPIGLSLIYGLQKFLQQGRRQMMVATS